MRRDLAAAASHKDAIKVQIDAAGDVANITQSVDAPADGNIEDQLLAKLSSGQNSSRNNAITNVDQLGTVK